jgi:proteic killer suppression protein
VIGSFTDAETERIFGTGKSRHLSAIARVAARRLGMIDFAKEMRDLREPPGNRMEQLSGNRAGQWSVRISDQYRICFRWVNDTAYDVEIVAYH